MDDPELVREFNRDMQAIYTRAKKETGYNATAFLRMLTDHGGMETARRLVMSHKASAGFTSLWERRRLDLTVESLVLQDRYVDLFDDDLRDQARDRLAEYGYPP